MAKKKAVKVDDRIVLERLEDAIILVPILGLTPIIPHRWSEKAKRLMPGHPDGSSVKKTKEKRDPIREAFASLYLFDYSVAIDAHPSQLDYGVPATAFKAAIVGACRFFDAPTMVEAKQLVWVVGEGPEQLIRIEANREANPWESMPRNANGNADLRYRYRLFDWTAVLKVQYTPSRITRDSVVALVDAGGRGGVCDWRPSAPKSYTGIYGTWRVDQTKEVEDVQ